jgi:hypothetical protein
MLRTVKAMKGFSIGAKDGDIGETVDFVFDDKAWTIRYVVVDTGKWLSGRRVLISPIVVGPADWENKRIPVLLNQEQVKNSPDISLNEELSQQDEIKYYDHFGWPYYWMGDDIWGPASVPTELALEGIERQKVLTESINQSHLRSAQEVIDYSIKSTDGDIGRVSDFIADDTQWTIRYIVVDTRTWWPGKKVLVAPQWIAHVDWRNSNVYLNLSQNQIKTGPEFHPSDFKHNYDQELYENRGRSNFGS